MNSNSISAFSQSSHGLAVPIRLLHPGRSAEQNAPIHSLTLRPSNVAVLQIDAAIENQAKKHTDFFPTTNSNTGLTIVYSTN